LQRRCRLNSRLGTSVGKDKKMSVINERQFGAQKQSSAPVNLRHMGREGEAAARGAQKNNGGAPLDRSPSPSSGSMQRAGTLWRRG
jgi:hypothetical protein